MISRSTAFIVIHGIGEQDPFETLDSFARGLLDYLASSGITFRLENRFRSRKNVDGHEGTESYVRIIFSEGISIDLHEFYWAAITEKKINVWEVLEWAQQTLEATAEFYKDNEELHRKYEVRKEKLSYTPFHFPISRLIFAIKYFYPILALIRFFSDVFDQVFRFLKPFTAWLGRRAALLLVDYVGDVAIYTTSDEKSDRYRIRQQILFESLRLLEEVLNGPYDEVIVAGHSLGSVIAYDTLNRLNIKANVDPEAGRNLNKLSGLVTFGSPLDKIAFFFREHTTDDECIRRQIMEHLHSFKSKPLAFQENRYSLDNTLSDKLDHIKWINFYSEKDPVSGHLDFYDVNENILLDLKARWGVAHVAYWACGGMYGRVLNTFRIACATMEDG